MYSREELDLIWNILDNIKNDGYIHGQDIRKLCEMGIPYRTLHKDNPDQNFNEFLHKVYEWACNPYNPNEENDTLRRPPNRRLEQPLSTEEIEEIFKHFERQLKVHEKMIPYSLMAINGIIDNELWSKIFINMQKKFWKLRKSAYICHCKLRK